MSDFDRWEEESTDLERDIVESFHYHQAKSWGNSYWATTKTAVAYGVPRYVVDAAIQHYDEVVNHV
jgi:hypothetical protein